jgi:aminoglycoside 6'-N-acetyltransferase I
MNVTIRLLEKGDEGVLEHVSSGIFDERVRRDLTLEFLNDPRHHMAVAMDAGIVVGFVSAVHYVHPDKLPELWINEVAVAPTHVRQGIARRMLETMLEAGRGWGCVNAWVLTHRANLPAMNLYASLKGANDPEDCVMFEFDLSSEAS